jgi:hypothetical protein
MVFLVVSSFVHQFEALLMARLRAELAEIYAREKFEPLQIDTADECVFFNNQINVSLPSSMNANLFCLFSLLCHFYAFICLYLFL